MEQVILPTMSLMKATQAVQYFTSAQFLPSAYFVVSPSRAKDIVMMFTHCAEGSPQRKYNHYRAK
jgi:hypothetical protein